jgi:pyruvate-ferredoxin/flavodoxin oxidoreductase
MKADMGRSQEEMKKAVEAGYWHLYRHDPLKKKEGKNPFTLDSKPPVGDIAEFMSTENRFASLALSYPDRAKRLYEKAKKDAAERYETYRRMAESKE